jgi:hypothetical protein
MGDRLTDQEYARLFETYEHNAFRLETRRFYNAEDEREAVRCFLAGEPIDLGWLQPWLRQVAATTTTGRRLQRVRLITNPPSDYLRFALWTTPHLIEAGEEIRYLPEDQALRLNLPRHDFWLFDSRRVAKLRYDSADRLSAAELISDPAELTWYVQAQSAALQHAMPFALYRDAYPDAA